MPRRRKKSIVSKQKHDKERKRQERSIDTSLNKHDHTDANNVKPKKEICENEKEAHSETLSTCNKVPIVLLTKIDDKMKPQRKKDATEIVMEESMKRYFQFQMHQSKNTVNKVNKFLVMKKQLLSADRRRQKALSMKKKRSDPKYREKETLSKKLKRSDTEYRQRESQRENVTKKMKRSDTEYRQRESQQENVTKKMKRSDTEYRQRESQQENVTKKVKRLDSEYKQRERISKRLKRSDTEYRQRESQQENVTKKVKRLDSEYKQRECISKRLKRSDTEYRHGESRRETVAKKISRTRQMTNDELITNFQSKVREGPAFICACCEQTWFKHSVTSSKKIRDTNETAKKCLPLVQGEDEWICNTCKRYIVKDKVPPLAKVNGMKFPEKPAGISDLHALEWRLLAPRIPFMKIYSAPRGKQRKIRGNVVNVPANVVNTVKVLPRAPDDNMTIAAKLKRQLKYSHAVMSENIRPYKVMQMANWLEENGDLYKREGIEFDAKWIDAKESENDVQPCMKEESQTEMEKELMEDVTVVSDGNEIPKGSTEQTSPAQIVADNSDVDEDNSDNDWDEIEPKKSAGCKDTLLSSPDFIEDDEKEKVHSFAPGEGNVPLSVFTDVHSEELAFPDIFLGQTRPPAASRETNVHYSDICKSELRRKDRRAAKNTDNIFFKMKKLQMKTLLGQVQVAMRKNKTKGKEITAGDLRTPGYLKNLVQFDEGYMVLKTLRGSPPYFKKAKSDLFAMIRQLGPAQYFTSFSAAETHWKHLLRILGKMQDEKDYTDEEIAAMNWETKCRLIAGDPVTCARQFDHQVNVLFKDILQTNSSPLGKVSDFFYRVEFQHRGSPHIHALLWVEDAPIYGQSKLPEVIADIDAKIQCKRNVDDKALQELVNYQVHKHSHTCKRKDEKVCRFGFPKPPMQETQILEPLEDDITPDQLKVHKANYKNVKDILDKMKEGEDISFHDFLLRTELTLEEYILAVRSSIKHATVFLKRQPNEIRVNAYNPTLLKAWGANIDIQVVLDVFACAMYIASYISKSMRGISDILRKACDEVNKGNNDIRQQVRTIGNKFLNNVEISAQEAVYIVLQLPMRKASREVVFVNTSPPGERVFLLKSKEQLDRMEDDDDDIQSSNQNERYRNRPMSMNDITFAEYNAWYDHRSNVPKKASAPSLDGTLPECEEENNSDDEEIETTKKRNVCYKKRKVPRIIRYVGFNVDAEPEKHYRELLMLYSPWRNEEKDLIGNCKTFKERYDQIKDDVEIQRQIYESNRLAVEAAIAGGDELAEDAHDELAPTAQQVNEEDEATEKDNEMRENEQDGPKKYEYDMAQDLGLSKTNKEEMNLYEMPEDEYRTLMRSLNESQLDIVNDVVHHLKTSDKQLFRFISGSAGVGKSFVTTAIFQTMQRFYKSKAGDDYQRTRLLLLAPTGKAAYNIKGNTIHSALKVPANQSLEYKSLDTGRLNTMRNELGALKVIFIDEISMVGNKMFNFIHQRLQDVMGSKEAFGGVSVICIGDLFQLKPVFDGFVFENSKHGLGPLATNMWQEHFTMSELTEIMRQKESKEFAELLNRLREGNHTEKDLQILKSRLITRNETPYPYKDQHLFISRAKVDNFNDQIFAKIDEEKHSIKASDSIIGNESKAVADRILNCISKDPNQTMQLQSNLNVAIGMRCELCINVNVEDGMTNGAGCVVKCIELTKKERALGGVLWVQFDEENVGQKQRKEMRNFYHKGIQMPWTPLQPVSREIGVGKYKNAKVMRTQFPIRPSSAKTVHRAQGSTLDKVVVDFEGRKMAHIHYVGLSRVRTLEGLRILDLNEKKIDVDNKVKKEMHDLRTNRKTKLDSSQKLKRSKEEILIMYHNVRSLQKYIEDVRANRTMRTADVIILAETRLKACQQSKEYDLENFKLFRNDAATEGNAKHHGLAVYVHEKYCNEDFSIRTANFKDVEMSMINLQIELDGKSKQLSIVGIYRSPTVSMRNLYQAVKHCKTLMRKSDVHMIIGDFNVNIRNECKKLNEEIKMKQFIEEYTTDSGTIIDHIYTDISHEMACSGVLESYFSDHKVIYIRIGIKEFDEVEQSEIRNTNFKTENGASLQKKKSGLEKVSSHKVIISETGYTKTSKSDAIHQVKRKVKPTHSFERDTTAILVTSSDSDSDSNSSDQVPNVICRALGHAITQGDLDTLQPGTWLNDQVINIYLKTVESRENEKGKNIVILDTFAYERIKRNMNYAKKFYENKNLMSKDIICMPVHFPGHWALVIIFVNRKVIRYYDSLHSERRGKLCLQKISKFIEKISKENANTWTLAVEERASQQNNSFDCGVYVCMFIDRVLSGSPPEIERNESNGYREIMRATIMSLSSLPSEQN